MIEHVFSLILGVVCVIASVCMLLSDILDRAWEYVITLVCLAISIEVIIGSVLCIIGVLT